MIVPILSRWLHGHEILRSHIWSQDIYLTLTLYLVVLLRLKQLVQPFVLKYGEAKLLPQLFPVG